MSERRHIGNDAKGVGVWASSAVEHGLRQYTPRGARKLAALLIRAADEVEFQRNLANEQRNRR